MTFPPIARPSDPATSHEAARKHTENGARGTIMDRCLEVVRREPGLIRAEIAARVGLGEYEISKRLSDLKNAHKVYQGQQRYAAANRPQVTWWPEQARMEDFIGD